MLRQRKWLIYCWILLGMQAARAQFRIGAGLGMTWDNLKTAGWSNSELQPGTGWLAEVPMEYRLSGPVYVATTLLYATKNYTIRRVGQWEGIYETHQNGYFQLPLVVRVLYGGKWQWSAGAGVYTGYWTGGRLKGKIPDIFSVRDSLSGNGQTTEYFQLTGYDTKYAFDSRRDRRFEFGWVLEAGLRYQVTKKCALFLQGNYFQSLTDQQKAYLNGVATRNRVWSISSGIFLQPFHQTRETP